MQGWWTKALKGRIILFLFLWGCLMGLTPASSYGWIFSWVLLAPLWFYCLRFSGWRWAAGAGFAWGFGYHGTALSWIWGLHPMTWMGIPWSASLLIAIAAWAIVSVWGAIIPMSVALTILGLRKRPFHPLWRIWIGVSFWCLLEWLWTQSPLWWTALSYTQSPYNPAILHLGQLSGPSLVSAVLVGVNALWAEAFDLAGGKRSLRRVKNVLHTLWQVPQSRRFVAGAIALLLTAHGIGAILWRQPLVQQPDDALKIGIIQGNIPTRIKLFPQGLDRAFKDYLEGYQTLVAQGADAVLLPEGAFPTRWSPDASRYRPIVEAIAQNKVLAWIGAFMPEGESITQSLVTVTAKDSRYSQYDKVKLVPLGEYLPFKETLGQIISRLTPLSYEMIPGATNQLMDTPFGRAIVSICYDSAFPQLFRHQTAAGGEFILSVANNDPYSARMMAQHHAQDVMRAIENDRWVARSTNTGFSSVIDPHGGTEWRSQRNRYETYLTTIQKRQTQTLYVRWGAWFLGFQVVVSALGMVRKVLKRR